MILSDKKRWLRSRGPVRMGVHGTDLRITENCFFFFLIRETTRTINAGRDNERGGERERASGKEKGSRHDHHPCTSSVGTARRVRDFRVCVNIIDRRYCRAPDFVRWHHDLNSNLYVRARNRGPLYPSQWEWTPESFCARVGGGLVRACNTCVHVAPANR